MEPDHPITSAAQWLQDVMLGAPATGLATIAVAWVGYEMFDGRISVRRAVLVIIGCCILFGAPAIVAGLRRPAPAVEPPTFYPSLPTPTPSPIKTPPYDPYAGAAVPTR